ncbi:MAG: hypothetical protein GFH27_549301n17 [Chloroflexi bacterium AL-W]|nr:hypothetical protein [Chloroflexi bacterium AL-N10]NOK73856.1 hypothetical protein [Chloroflexi bacterium AL-N5]NOK82824.1 hypothetical protein [Chloroflexi bacterium AL-W]NOK90346.1 hypothetical protein [Chloroflexi bacterium AL-N15]
MTQYVQGTVPETHKPLKALLDSTTTYTLAHKDMVLNIICE